MTLLEGPEAEELHRLRGAAPIVFGPDALDHPRSVRLGGHCTTPYEEITHLAVGSRGLRLGTRGGCFLFRRHHFVDSQGPEAVAREVLRRVGVRPGGAAQQLHMAELDRRMLDRRALRVGPVLAAAAIALFGLQMLVPEFHHLGFFSATLVSLGEGWRLITANFLHGSLPHLFLNAACLAAFGGLLERSVGGATTIGIAAASGLGATLGCWLAGYEMALGASGIVYGMIGALLWLEFKVPEQLPVLWRLPRRLFVGLLLAETVLLWGFPAVAHGAHFGGFLGGALACGLVIRPAYPDAPLGRLSRRIAGLAVVVTLWAFAVQASAILLPDPAGIARRAEALLELGDVSPEFLNNEAWRIAVSGSAGPRDLHVAGMLAERAVRETAGRDPTILDTLAEVYFQAGRRDEALQVIDAAISLAPHERYYREQRRRFSGEREAGDRPADPLPWGFPPADEEELRIPPSDSAIRV